MALRTVLNKHNKEFKHLIDQYYMENNFSESFSETSIEEYKFYKKVSIE